MVNINIICQKKFVKYGELYKFSLHEQTSNFCIKPNFSLIQDQYVYDTGGFITEAQKGGERLVGASKADHNTIPFIVYWTIDTLVDDDIGHFSCSGKTFFLLAPCKALTVLVLETNHPTTVGIGVLYNIAECLKRILHF
jgi:hypothetical protein